MATIGTRSQGYQPISTYSPLDYKTFMQGVQTIRNRYDQGRRAMTAYERLYGMDLGGNESAQGLMNQVKSDIDSQLQGIRDRGNYEDAEFDILDAATQFVSDPRIHALQDANNIRRQQEQFIAQSGGNHAVYDFAPYSQHQFIGEDGKIQRFSNQMEKLENWQLMQKTLIGNIKEDGRSFGLTRAEIDQAESAFLKYGSISEITDAKIREVVDKVYKAYADTKEGRQQLRVLNDQIAKGELSGNPEDIIKDQMIGISAPQKFRDTKTSYTQDPVYMARLAAGGKQEEPDANFDPWATTMRGIARNGYTGMTQNIFVPLNGGDDKLQPQTAIVGKDIFNDGTNNPIESGEFLQVSDAFNKMKGAQLSLSGIQGILKTYFDYAHSPLPGAATAKAFGDFQSSVKEIAKTLRLAEDDSEEAKALLAHINNPQVYKDRKAIGALGNQVEQYMKSKFSFLAESDLSEGLPVMKLRLPAGTVEVKNDAVNTRVVNNISKGRKDLMVTTMATVSLADLKTNNPGLSDNQLEQFIKDIDGYYTTSADGANTMVTIPAHLVYNDAMNKDNYQQWGTTTKQGYDQAHYQRNYSVLEREAEIGTVLREGTEDNQKSFAKKVLSSLTDENGNQRFPEVTDAMAEEYLKALKQEYGIE